MARRGRRIRSLTDIGKLSGRHADTIIRNPFRQRRHAHLLPVAFTR
ncbi:MAG: hypothetical protein HUJ18_11285 [Marinobacter sp.]|nr:hypothetical protein [Marinobacter sp.]